MKRGSNVRFPPGSSKRIPRDRAPNGVLSPPRCCAKGSHFAPFEPHVIGLSRYGVGNDCLEANILGCHNDLVDDVIEYT